MGVYRLRTLGSPATLQWVPINEPFVPPPTGGAGLQTSTTLVTTPTLQTKA